MKGLLKNLILQEQKKVPVTFATDRGISSLPIIIEMYLFSIQTIDESVLDESQINIKEQALSNRQLFEETKINEYYKFSNQLKEDLIMSKLLVEV